MKKILFTLALGLFILTSLSGSARAVTPEWPAWQWGSGPVIMSPERHSKSSGTGDYHLYDETTFAVFKSGNTLGLPGSFDVRFNPYGPRCNTNDIAGQPGIYARIYLNNSAVPNLDTVDCSEGTKTLTVAYSNGYYSPSTYTTVYKIRVHINGIRNPTDITDANFPNDEIRGYAFTVNSTDDNVTIGVLRNEMIAFIVDQPYGSFNTLTIPQQPPWDVFDAGWGSSYDYDNFPNNAAQEDGAGNDVYNSISFGPASYPYVAASGWNPALGGAAAHRWDSYTPGGDQRYMPINSDTGQWNHILYTTAPQTEYAFRIHELGRNYLGIQLPFDGGTEGPLGTLSAVAEANFPVNVGNTATFDLHIDGSGFSGPQGTFNWNVQQSLDGGATATDLAGPGLSGTTTGTNGPRLVTSNPTYTPDTRGTICYRITISSVFSPSITLSPQTSPWQCATVNGRDISYGSNVTAIPGGTGANVFVTTGTSVRFDSWVCNSGPAPTHKFVDGNVTVPGDPIDLFTLDLGVGTGVGGCGSKSVTKVMNAPGEFCQDVTVTPIADNNAGPGTSRSCAYVIAVTPDAPGYDEYEKGSTGITLDFGINIDAGGVAACPAGVAVTIVWTYSIGAPINLLQSDSFTYGNGTCLPRDNTIVTFDAAQTTLLNNANPGTTFPTNVTVNGLPEDGTFGVIEVPFVRFYGNDTFARTGDVRFNDSPTFESAYKGRGSTSQYGSFIGAATANNSLATASFRFGLPAAPYTAHTQPEDGLRSNIGATTPLTVTQVVDKIDLPDDCRVVSGNNLTSQPNPYDWGGLDPYQRVCYNVSGPGPINITPSAGAWSYNGKYTIKTADGVDMYISQNFTNTGTIADYQDPGRTPVLLLISGGDVYIHKNVSQIDAVIIAKGTVYTCAENSTTNVVKAQRDESCRETNLTINGSVVADTILFDRSVGTRYLSTEADHGGAAGVVNLPARGYGGVANASNTDAARSRASEIINFPAYLYFARPYLEDTSDTTYSALFNAAPRY